MSQNNPGCKDGSTRSMKRLGSGKTRHSICIFFWNMVQKIRWIPWAYKYSGSYILHLIARLRNIFLLYSTLWTLAWITKPRIRAAIHFIQANNPIGGARPFRSPCWHTSALPGWRWVQTPWRKKLWQGRDRGTHQPLPLNSSWKLL